jgi:bacteriocin biosynthesis cyclodehydratase domain-containing protein
MEHPSLNRIKLRRDAVFLRTDNGIYFKTKSHTFTLKGKTVYDTFLQLIPYMDGSGKCLAVLETLDKREKELVTKLLLTLLERGVAHNVSAEEVKIEENVAHRFQSHLEFLEHCGDRPRERFLLFRESHILLLGHGLPFLSAGSALLRNGLRELSVDISASDNLDIFELQCRELEKEGVISTVKKYDTENLQSLNDFDLIVFVADGNEYHRIAHWNTAANTSNRRLLAGFALPGKTVVGPCVTPGRPGCWLCAILRWANNAPPGQAAELWQEIATCRQFSPTGTTLSEPLANMLGNNVAFEAFKLCAGQPEPETPGKLLIQDIMTLETSIFKILPHPGCTVCAGSSDSSKNHHVGYKNGKPLSEAGILSIWEELMNDQFGVFQGFDDEAVDQLPLRLSSVRLHITTDWEKGKTISRVYGWSQETTNRARYKAISEAVRLYTLFTGRDPRVPVQAVRFDETDSLTRPFIPLNEIRGWIGNIPGDRETKHWVNARSMTSHREVLVPAAAVYPFDDKDRTFQSSFMGVGVGLTRDSAALNGILSLFAETAISDLIQGKIRLMRWAPVEGRITKDTAYYFSTLRRLNLSPVILVGSLQNVQIVFATTKSGNAIAIEHFSIAAGISFSAALDSALSELIAREQIQQAGWEFNAIPCQHGMFGETTISIETCSAGDVSLESISATPEEQLTRLLEQVKDDFLFVDITPADVQATATFHVCKILCRLASTGKNQGLA